MEQISPKGFTTLKSRQTEMYRVSFENQYHMKVVGHFIHVQDFDKKSATSSYHRRPSNGAVKEQSADVYASTLAERGFITLAVDLAFWGENDGEPKNAISPDMYSETFNAAVDF